jgi:hypothetical protein
LDLLYPVILFCEPYRPFCGNRTSRHALKWQDPHVRRNIFTDDSSPELFSHAPRCEDLSAGYPDFTLEIRNGTLYSENVAVGAINENSMTLAKVDKEDGSTFRLHLEKVPPNRLRYVEEWTENGRPALTVEGLLTGRNF